MTAIITFFARELKYQNKREPVSLSFKRPCVFLTNQKQLNEYFPSKVFG